MSIQENKNSKKTIISILVVITGIIILRNAWVSDDAYIGFRTVYNFVNGYGLTFNITERVQSFTNPLWILLMSLFYFFTGEAYFTSIAISVILTLGTLYLIATKLSNDLFTAIIVFALASSSKAFIDYSTSGLENPLGHFFIVLFACVWFGEMNINKKVPLLFFIASLAAVNRLDNLLLFIFPLVTQLRHLSKKNILLVLAGASPLVLWEMFSLVYYGFLLPNTYYTKLNAGIASSEYIEQGKRYLANSFYLDPVTLISISASVILAVFFSIRNKSFRVLPFVFSILIYIFYIIKVGGDFMSGRFLTYVFLISIIIFTQIKLNKIVKYAFIPFIIVIFILSPYSPAKSDASYRNHELTFSKIVTHNGVADERAWYYPRTGLLHLKKDLFIIAVEIALDNQINYKDSIVKFVDIEEVLGFSGYEVGPNAYIFHRMGLSDPLISRLPLDRDLEIKWRIGHLDRKIPEGYIETLKTGVNQMTDKNLALFYEKLSLIIKGNIFSRERFETIIRMNTGQYDYLIDKRFYESVRNR